MSSVTLWLQRLPFALLRPDFQAIIVTSTSHSQIFTSLVLGTLDEPRMLGVLAILYH